MLTAFYYLVIVIFFVIALNFVFLIFRIKGNKSHKPRRDILDEEEAVVWRDKEIRRRLDREQEDLSEYVELRNKTLALYDEVRRNAAAREREEQVKEATEIEPTKEEATKEETAEVEATKDEPAKKETTKKEPKKK